MDDDDDQLIAEITSTCRSFMHPHPTLTNLTVSYNLLIGFFRLCCICGDPEDLKTIAKNVYDGLIEEIQDG